MGHIVIPRSRDRKAVTRNLTYLQKENNAKTWGEDRHVQAKESSLEQILPSSLLEETNTAETLISDF